MPAHSNALVAAIFFIAVIVSDALTAVDSTEHADVPASLRGSSLALVCSFAAPVLIRPQQAIYGWAQRPIIAAALFAAALAGAHHGGSQTRAFDAIYTTVVCFSVLWLFSAGGIDEAARATNKGDKMDKAVSTSSAMFAASMLLYGGIRIMRAGLRHATEVRTFRVQPEGLYNASDAVNTLGYAYASDVATISVSFGGAIGVGAAMTIVAHVHELASGTDAVATQLGVAAVFQMVAALAAALTYGDQVNWLPAVFGDSACRGGSDKCAAAATSRRFSSVNTQVPGLWLSAMGLFALSYPVSSRFQNRAHVSSYTWHTTGALFGLAACVSALILTYLYSDFSGRGGHTDYVMLVSIVAIYWSVFWDTFLGTAIYVVAFVVDEIFYVRDYGLDEMLSHLTHVTLVISASLLALHLLLQTIAFVWAPRRLELLIGMTTAAGTSASLGLYCASACLLMANNGSLGDLQDTNDGTRFAISFILQHFVPVLIWAPLFTCRCEIQLLNRAQRLVVWIATVPLVLLVYAGCLAALGVSPPTAALMDATALAGCVVGAGVAPWLAASSV